MTVKPIQLVGARSQPTAKKDSLVSVLAVGEPTSWSSQDASLPSGEIAYVPFQDIGESVLDLYNPDVIFSPALATAFDCIELALLLHNLGYAGSYRAIAKDLPNPELVEREVKQICPRLDFQVVIAN